MERKPLQIKFSEKERRIIDKAAKEANLPTGTWLRVTALAAAEQRVFLSTVRK